MHFELAIEIDAPQQRVWDLLTELEAWLRCLKTIDTVELLTLPPIATGSRCASSPRASGKSPPGTRRLPRVASKTGGIPNFAGHRVETLGDGRA